jgi:pimeloyl-ACP methyl ester carboxylesterase
MRRPALLSLVSAAALSACADQTLVGPSAFSPAGASRIESSSTWSRVVEGETGPGSRYALYMPASWNGTVVYYAHGIKPAFAPVELPTGDGFPAVREALGARGYAVAYSSFSENGWAQKDGMQRTHQLRGLFTSAFEAPTRNLLMGTSLGGLVVQQLAETHPEQYDGVFAMCAPLGGTATELTYIADVRVLFDFFYPGVVPGTVLSVPPGVDFDRDVLPGVIAAVTANPTGLGVIARMAQTPLAGSSPTELLTSLIYALKYDFIGIDDFLGRTHGHSMYDNSGTVYAAAAPGLLPDALLYAINKGVGRFTSTPDAEQYLSKYFQPSGSLAIPTLTLHTTRDPLVPFFHEARFAASVAGAGSSGLLLQQSVGGFGHCAFSTEQMVDGVESLSRWVATGVRPTL